jgi:hypothetical protein
MIKLTIKALKIPRIQSMIFWAILIPIISIGFKWAFYTVMPATFFFEYYSVEPTKAIFQDGEDLIFKSHFQVNRSLNFHYNDILRCNIDEYDNGFHSQVLGKISLPSIGERTSIWTYNHTPPSAPRTCFLDTTIRAELPYNVTKVQKIRSESFIIKK